MKSTLLKVILLFSICSYLLAKKDVYCSKGWEMISSGRFHTLGLYDGTIYAWGANDCGQLGLDQEVGERSEPDYIPWLDRWSFVATKTSSSFGISFGRLYAWGDNSYGQLGINSTNTTYNPTQVGNDTDWVSVAPGYQHVLGLKKNGSLYIWGTGYLCQNGTATTSVSLTPLQILPDSNWTSITAGYGYSLALRKDGALFSWGNNSVGQLGNGTYDTQDTPVRVGGENATFTTISAGRYHNLAIGNDTFLYSWGGNQFGELGKGSHAGNNSNIPIIPWGGNDTYLAVSAGLGFSMAIDWTGDLYECGINTYGQLGDGWGNNHTTLAKVGGGFKFKSASAGEGHAFGITREEGFILGWGLNVDAQLGTGNHVNRASPKVCPVPPSPPKNDHTLMIVLIVLGAILIVGGIIAYIKSRKSSQEELLPSEERTQT